MIRRIISAAAAAALLAVPAAASAHVTLQPAGTKLAFKALQTYSGGEVVRWIGAEDSDNPAPIVSVTDGDAAAPAAATPAPAQAAATPAPAETSDDSGNGLAIVALIVGALGLIVGAAGLMAARRASGRSGVAA